MTKQFAMEHIPIPTPPCAPVNAPRIGCRARPEPPCLILWRELIFPALAAVGIMAVVFYGEYAKYPAVDVQAWCEFYDRNPGEAIAVDRGYGMQTYECF